MSRTFRGLVMALVAAGALMAGSMAASAATITAEPGEITSDNRQTLTFGTGFLTTACNFTMTGTVAERITGEAGRLIQIGGITGGTGGACAGAASEVDLLTPFPWLIHIAFELVRRTGTPSTEVIAILIQILLAKFELHGIPIAGDCLYQETVKARATLTGTPNSLSSLVFFAEDNNDVRFITGGFGCPNPGVLAGSTPLSPRLNLALAL